MSWLPATRMIEIAMESSERLTRLINEILDAERIESGAMPMQIGPHRVADLLAVAHDQVVPLADGAGIAVQVGRADGTVVADADRVVQTLINLVGNAIKFSAPGSRVLVSAEPTGSTGAEMILFRVVDEGRGIPENRLEVIFERFEQVDSTDAREKGAPVSVWPSAEASWNGWAAGSGPRTTPSVGRPSRSPCPPHPLWRHSRS